ncbi:MAG: TIGR01620 family protein [Hyphomicrobiaceae bacterium]|nr:TIGR01620 family protein [Hyphomicrobiaceae bacterium]
MTGEGNPRKPQAFSLDDPDLVDASDTLSLGGAGPETPSAPSGEASGARAASPAADARLATTGIRHGIPWGAVLLSALGGLLGLAMALSMAQFVAAAFERQDWIGWTAFALLAVAGLALVVIVVREIGGLLRMRRLGRARRDLEAALARRDGRAEKRAIEDIFSGLAGRPELKWPLATLAEHAKGIHDPGDLARLADRDVMPALDGDARRLVAASARRVSLVTALSPAALITVGWVLIENLRLLRALATLYGGRPGLLGTSRLARMVFTHILATGGIALTDDLLGQFLGQDLVRRLSRRLGESLFNAALTARVGAAAVEVIRPLPYIAAPRVRARDFITEIARWSRTTADEVKEDRPHPAGRG